MSNHNIKQNVIKKASSNSAHPVYWHILKLSMSKAGYVFKVVPKNLMETIETGC